MIFGLPAVLFPATDVMGPKGNLPRLFTAFFTSKPKGTGLGPPIVAKMLAKMNCTIDIVSQAMSVGR